MSRLTAILVRGIPALIALLCVAAIAPWILGIPGTPDAPYARGWYLGLLSLFGYLLAYGVVAVLLLARSVGLLPIKERYLHIAAWVAVCAFVAGQTVAWSLMLLS